eukprot:4144539-Amphidinium_carterae.1
MALQFAAESCRGDREVVLAAVKNNGFSLEFAAESCRGDQEIVLSAVKESWQALELAAESCRGDRDIILAALERNPLLCKDHVLQCASDELLEDSSFAIEAKKRCHILKISMISGRQAIVVCHRANCGMFPCKTEAILSQC